MIYCKDVIWNMIKPYDFVPFLKCKSYEGNGSLEGHIPIRVKALTPLHIFSGHYRVEDNGNAYREFIRRNGKPIIPGTSFKGCIRTIAESISYSCLQTAVRDARKLPDNKTHDRRQKCVICDMFGCMGSRSKVRFCDLEAVSYKTGIRGMPRSFQPHPESSYYIENGRYKGYKFYKHGIDGIQPAGPILCECVNAGAEFEGEIIYKDLTVEQLGLLCFSLGLSGHIQPKIGYGRSYFYGSIEVSAPSEWAKYAGEYIDTCGAEVRRNMDALIGILSYKNVLRSYEW